MNNPDFYQQIARLPLIDQVDWLLEQTTPGTGSIMTPVSTLQAVGARLRSETEINGLQIGQRVHLKHEPRSGLGFEATIAGHHTEAWSVRLSDGSLYNVDSFDISIDSPRFGDGRPEDNGLPKAVDGEPLPF